MALPGNTMAKLSEVVPQGPHFASKPYWVSVSEEGKYSCEVLTPEELILRMARLRAQMPAEDWPRETHSFHRAHPVRLEVCHLVVKGSSERRINPRQEHFAVVRDELLFELVRLFGHLEGVFSDSQQVMVAVAYDYWSRECGKVTPAEHRGFLASSAKDLATLVAPSL